MSAEWIATLADGSEQKYRIEHWRGIPIVELRRKGEPSRSQMRAALKSAEGAKRHMQHRLARTPAGHDTKAFGEQIADHYAKKDVKRRPAERDSDHGEGCDSCHALALVLAALGARS